MGIAVIVGGYLLYHFGFLSPGMPDADLSKLKDDVAADAGRLAQALTALGPSLVAVVKAEKQIEKAIQTAVIQADVACPGLVVVGDSYYRGWRAFVDGRRVPIQEVVGVRAVRADAGNHTIQFVYFPRTVYVGFALTLIGILLTASIALHDSRNTRAVPHTVD